MNAFNNSFFWSANLHGLPWFILCISPFLSVSPIGYVSGHVKSYACLPACSVLRKCFNWPTSCFYLLFASLSVSMPCFGCRAFCRNKEKKFVLFVCLSRRKIYSEIKCLHVTYPSPAPKFILRPVFVIFSSCDFLVSLLVASKLMPSAFLRISVDSYTAVNKSME